MLVNKEQADNKIFGILNAGQHDIPVVIVKFDHTPEEGLIPKKQYKFVKGLNGDVSVNSVDYNNLDLELYNHEEGLDVILTEDLVTKTVSIDHHQDVNIDRYFTINIHEYVYICERDRKNGEKKFSKDVTVDGRALIERTYGDIYAIITFGKNPDDAPFINMMNVSSLTDDNESPDSNKVAEIFAEHWFNLLDSRQALRTINAYCTPIEVTFGEVTRTFCTTEAATTINDIKESFYDQFMIENCDVIQDKDGNKVVTKAIAKAGILSKKTYKAKSSNSPIYFKIYDEDNNPVILAPKSDEFITETMEERFFADGKKFSRCYTYACTDKYNRLMWLVVNDTFLGSTIYAPYRDSNLSESSKYITYQIFTNVEAKWMTGNEDNFGVCDTDPTRYKAMAYDSDSGTWSEAVVYSPYLAEDIWLDVEDDLGGDTNTYTQVWRLHENGKLFATKTYSKADGKSYELQIYNPCTVGDESTWKPVIRNTYDAKSEVLVGYLGDLKIYDILSNNRFISIRDAFEFLQIDCQEKTCDKYTVDKSLNLASGEKIYKGIYTRDVFMISHEVTPNIMGVLIEY